MSSSEQPGATLWATREQMATRYQVHARTVDE